MAKGLTCDFCGRRGVKAFERYVAPGWQGLRCTNHTACKKRVERTPS